MAKTAKTRTPKRAVKSAAKPKRAATPAKSAATLKGSVKANLKGSVRASAPKATAARMRGAKAGATNTPSARPPTKTSNASAVSSRSKATKTSTGTTAIASSRAFGKDRVQAASLKARAATVPAIASQVAFERADLPPTSGFSMLVDGHFKSAFGSLKQAKDAAADLLARFPMLRIEVYDAAKKKRTPA